MHGTIRAARDERLRAAREKAYATPLAEFHPGHPELFRSDTLWPYFERLRDEEPVHFCSTCPVGSYWSVTKYRDIMHVDTNPAIFSSDVRLGGISLRDVGENYNWPSFIAMDEPKHGPQRKTVQPMFTPAHLDKLAVLIRERAATILDNLPRNETFNWVERVSIELTTQMLATLFDFPWEDRRKLTRWSDLATALPKSGIYDSEEQRLRELGECADYFTRLWNERVNAEPRSDLVSMMAHSDAMRHMSREELLGNLILLIVGGNDTTRNSMTGSVLALNENPDEYDKLRANPALIDSFVPEVIRWQTPLAHMRRTALADTELGGKLIRKGDVDPYAPPAEKEGADAGLDVPGDGGSKYRTSYYSFADDFTSNLKGSAGLIQVSLAASTQRDGRVLIWLRKHELAVRSRILIELADTPEEEIMTPEGKERLQKRLTAAINDVLTQAEGFGGINSVYFKSLRVQLSPKASLLRSASRPSMTANCCAAAFARPIRSRIWTGWAPVSRS